MWIPSWFRTRPQEVTEATTTEDFRTLQKSPCFYYWLGYVLYAAEEPE
jgi:hypothetical protein